MNFQNNEQSGPSGILVKEEIETDEAAGTKIIYILLRMPVILYYLYLSK